MITEEEAKAKWCPFARAIGHATDGATHAINRAYPGGELDIEWSRCIASACMAWRWAEKWDTLNDEYETGPLTRGYCGLAGKP